MCSVAAPREVRAVSALMGRGDRGLGVILPVAGPGQGRTRGGGASAVSAREVRGVDPCRSSVRERVLSVKKNSVGRRTFLTSAAAVAAGAAVASGLPPGLRGSRGLALAPAAALVNAPDPLLQEKVKHVVVLMQENHSFDDYFGMLKGVRGFGDRSVIDMPGTTGTSGQPSGRTVFQQPDVPADEDNVANPAGWRYPWPLNGGGSQGWEQAQNVGTDHGWGSGHMAWNNGKMDQWIKAKDQIGMGYLLPADLPFHYALADAYTVCDAYHCSVMGRTGPNRNYAWSGSTGEGMDGWTLQHLYAGSFMPEPEEKGDDAVPQTWVPYAQALQDAGVDWKTYHVRGDNFCDNALEYFKVFQDTEQYRDSTGSAHAREREMWQRGMGPTRAEIDDADEDAPGTADMIIAELTQDIAAGALPTVSWIVADEDHSEAAGNTPSKGAVFVKQVVEALAADEDVYNSTVLIINFDENDGFYDHVPPPVPDPDSDYAENEWLTDDDHNFVPIGLGFRVPMIVVSPWTRGGWVNSQVFDHTSVLRFLEKLTGVQCDNISAWRRKVCGDLTSIFDFDNPNPNTPTLPSPAPPGKTPGANANPSVDPIAPANSGSLPVQQTGVRPARALPYQANAYLDRYTGTGPAADQKAWINYENLGDPATSAVHFATYVNAYRGGGPGSTPSTPTTPLTTTSTSATASATANTTSPSSAPTASCDASRATPAQPTAATPASPAASPKPTTPSPSGSTSTTTTPPQPSPSPSPPTTTAPAPGPPASAQPALAAITSTNSPPAPTAGTTSPSPSATTPTGPSASSATSKPATPASPAAATDTPRSRQVSRTRG